MDRQRIVVEGLGGGFVRRIVLSALLALSLTGHASAQWIVPTQKWDNQTENIPEAVRSKPALFANFPDSAYGTQFMRVTDVNVQTSVSFNPVPEYSQIQAWNA